MIPMADKLKEGRLTWFGYILHRLTNVPIRKSNRIQVDRSTRKRGEPKLHRYDMK